MEEEINNKRCVPPMAMDEAPWLVYMHGDSKNKKIQTFCKISSNNKSKSYIKSIPELRDKKFVGSRCGWLLLQDDEETMFSLWNPVTLQTVDLPPSSACDEEMLFFSGTLTSPPLDPDNPPNRDSSCLVLLFGEGVIYSCRPSRANSQWIAQQLEIEGEPVVMREAVTIGSIIYGWAIVRVDGDDLQCLISLEVADDDDTNPLKLTSLRLSLPGWGCHPHDYLVESCARIYLVSVEDEDVNYRGRGVRLWELDLQGMNWVEVNCLGGRSFFLCYKYGSTWCWGTSGGGVEENCVYLVNSSNAHRLYSYRLHDDSLSLLSPCPSLVTPFNCPIWLMPQHQHPRFLAKPEWKQRIENSDVLLHQGVYKELPLQNKTTQEGNLCCEQLPLDILELISKHVHLFDYQNFRLSCKIFQSVVSIAQWKTHNVLPLLMFFKNDNSLCEVMDPFRDDSLHINLQLSRDFPAIDFSKDGWLLVRVGVESFQFFNPFTKVKGEFPPCEFTNGFASIGFSTNPTSPDCLTVGIIDRFGHVLILYLRTEDKTWNLCKFYHEGIEFSPGTGSPIYHAGAFYFLDKNGYLGVFELVGGEPSWRVYNSPHKSDVLFHSYHLVECDGELLSVFIGDIGKCVKVFRFNHSRKSWAQVKSLGNHILFIGPSSSFSAVTRKLGMGNKIYLARLRGNGIIYYSLGTRQYHVSGSEDPMEDFYGTTEPFRCCWV